MGANSSSNLKLKAKIAEAVEHGDVAFASKAITENPKVIQQEPGEPWSILHVACWSGQPKVVELLLLAGADPNAANRNTLETPLHYAAKLPGPASAVIVAALIQAGASVDARNKLGFTAMHFAAEQNNADVVRLLRQYGASFDAQTHEGATPASMTTSAAVADVLTSTPGNSRSKQQQQQQQQQQPGTPRPLQPSTSMEAIAASASAAALSAAQQTLFTFIRPEDLKLEEPLGSGATGKVFKATWLGSTSVAVKQFFPSQEREFETEVRGIANLGNHPHIVTTLGIVLGDGDKQPFCIVTELMERGSLFDHIHKKKRRISDRKIARIAKDIASGVLFLHSKGIIHRDIKPQNVLIADSHLRVKLCDFGLARAIDSSRTMTTALGTPVYMAPEVISGARYDGSADVYSFGMTLYEMLASEVPYSTSGVSNFQLPGKIAEGYRPPLPDRTQRDPRLIDLMVACWDNKPANRPTFEQILQGLRAAYP